jgi:hypothetical protein
MSTTGDRRDCPCPTAQKRILRETHGFEALTAEAAKLLGPVFAARYQTAAMLRFYQPRLEVNQWPGIPNAFRLERFDDLHPHWIGGW